MKTYIKIKGASQNNLKDISLEIPHHQLIVVTGVSGSGKSSLVFDVIAREGQRRYLETFSSFSRQFMGKISRPDVDLIEGLSPVITLSQKTVGNSSRSTVGTMSDLYDMLRLLFARLGNTDRPILLSRSLFSFNTDLGACPFCKGLGLEERISVNRLVSFPERSIRDGALAPTQPNGYIMYSQVTVDVLNQICQAHGFTTDIPWNQLTEDQQDVILNGSTKLKVPFGKHPLENRLKWTGITAKPREEDYYKGMLPIMTDILHRDRNDSILRFVESLPCSKCKGKRLNDDALSVTWKGMSIDRLCQLELTRLSDWLEGIQYDDNEVHIASPIVKKMLEQLNLMSQLGIGHLTLDRAAFSLSGSESQRIRLINQVYAELSNILYIFDEPTIGLHPAEKKPMLEIFRRLVNLGNTVIVVEHDEATIRQADWIIDIGPGAGEKGGSLLFNGQLADFLDNEKLKGLSPTYDFLHNIDREQFNSDSPAKGQLEFRHCNLNNLKNLDLQFQLGAINVVAGVSGSGKTSLVYGILVESLRNYLTNKTSAAKESIVSRGVEQIDKMITIDQAPIGRTPRSNPATYTGLADKLRDLFAQLPESRNHGYTKTHFSFNTAGGRCETCQGAGSQQIGMHFLGNVDIVCPSCNGKRFHDDVLQIRYNEKNIAEVLELTVDEALVFFKAHANILRYLLAMKNVGLGYLHLGQPSSTLSGGEAQRIKLASELQQADTGNSLYILDEPTTGLHVADIEVLIKALQILSQRGNTIVCIENDMDVIRKAEWILELGPGSGEKGGDLVFQGTPEEMSKSATSGLIHFIKKESNVPRQIKVQSSEHQSIDLFGVTTHLLKSIDVSIPKNKLTVITGLSGSGKSSLAFDTLFSEAHSRFLESMSSYTRSLLKLSNPAQLSGSKGLGAVVAISRKHLGHSSRSTVGTLTGLYDLYRLLFSRLAQLEGKQFTAGHFSFNNELGACPDCDGLGFSLQCDPDKLITHPGKSVLNGAISGHKAGLFYGDPHGQYVATLKALAVSLGLDLDLPWSQLHDNVRHIVLYGTGDAVYDVVWEYKNKTREGVHSMQSAWPGFCFLIEDEYHRKHLNKNTRDVEDLLQEIPCSTCKGGRLKPALLAVKFHSNNIADLSVLNINEAILFINNVLAKEANSCLKAIVEEIAPSILTMLFTLKELGLAHLSMNRNARTLSGGEGQRLRLAGALSAQLYGVTYVFDEPTIGLSASHVLPLASMIKRLISNGNTAVVVEHDELFIRQADHIIEMGPGAGQAGGRIVAAGNLQEIEKNPASLTGDWLSNPIHHQAVKRQLIPSAFGVKGADKHNLKGIDLDFIAGGIIAITGVSGSGKSSLLRDVILQSAQLKHPSGCKEMYGFERFEAILAVDQQPFNTNALSTPATYSGMMDVIRDAFAETEIARKKKLKKNVFSYLTKEGKCPDCNGLGQKRTAMDFMNDVWTLCDSCKGSRFQSQSLEASIQGYNIAEVLNLTIDEGLTTFRDQKKWQVYLQAMQSVGIGHLKIGQGSDSLSGGEAQRLKLAKELIHHQQGNTLYLFDEPTTGLHALDIEKLILVFNRLADQGNTIIFIEHNSILIEIANQIIELGPGSGPDGGYCCKSEVLTKC